MKSDWVEFLDSNKDTQIVQLEVEVLLHVYV